MLDEAARSRIWVSSFSLSSVFLPRAHDPSFSSIHNRFSRDGYCRYIFALKISNRLQRLSISLRRHGQRETDRADTFPFLRSSFLHFVLAPISPSNQDHTPWTEGSIRCDPFTSWCFPPELTLWTSSVSRIMSSRSLPLSRPPSSSSPSELGTTSVLLDQTTDFQDFRRDVDGVCAWRGGRRLSRRRGDSGMTSFQSEFKLTSLRFANICPQTRFVNL